MLVNVVRLWEDGKLIPRWRISYEKPVFGELVLREGHDEHLRRNLRIASLHNHPPKAGEPLDVIPPLVDAAVLYITDNRMSISGFERGDMLPTVAQTWLVNLA